MCNRFELPICAGGTRVALLEESDPVIWSELEDGITKTAFPPGVLSKDAAGRHAREAAACPPNL